MSSIVTIDFCTPIHGWVDSVRFLIKVANSGKNGCKKGSEHVHTHCVGLLLVFATLNIDC